MISLPPLARRIVVNRNWKSNTISLVEQVCIIPFGGGLWFPVRNLTKELDKLEVKLAVAEKIAEGLKASIKGEKDYINKEIERVGFYTDTVLVKNDKGDYKIINVKDIVDFKLGNDRKVTASAKPKTRTVKNENLLIETRKPKDSGNNKKQKGNNSN